jgi:hypothetical protein
VPITFQEIGSRALAFSRECKHAALDDIAEIVTKLPRWLEALHLLRQIFVHALAAAMEFSISLGMTGHVIAIFDK